jgi:hypothetical protein
MGDSAGAHLAALVALADETPPFAETSPNDPYAGVSTHVKVVVAVHRANRATTSFTLVGTSADFTPSVVQLAS